MTANTISTLGVRTIVSGAASGIDTAALVEAAYNQKKLQSDNLLTKISKNTSKITAYSTLQSLSQAVQTSLESLKRNYSVVGTSSSTFDARTGTLSSGSSTPATSLVGVSIASGTALGSYEIDVQQKAQVQRVGSDDTTTDKTADLGYTGTFDIGLAGYTATTINVTSDMSLSEIATAVNAVKETTGVSASILKTSENGYQLIFTGADTNKEMTISNITGTDVLQSLGMLDGTGLFVDELQAAQGAEILLDDVLITRDTNDFSDLIDGVSLTVKNSEPGTKIQLQIENDTTAISDALTTFVDAYNALRDFVTTNQEVVDGVASEDAVLFGDFTLKNMSTSIQTLLSASYNDSSASIQTLRDIGITIDSENHMVIDTELLDEALTNNLDELRTLFEASVTSDNSSFRVMGNTSKTKTFSAAIDITYSGGAITGVSIGGDNTLFDINGTLITGKAGTIYEGLSLAYVGTTSATINFSTTQGLGDLLSNTIDAFSDSVTGTIQGQKLNLTELNEDMELRSDRILERAEEYRDKLIDKYSGYESQIAYSKTILAQIQAILNASNNNN